MQPERSVGVMDSAERRIFDSNHECPCRLALARQDGRRRGRKSAQFEGVLIDRIPSQAAHQSVTPIILSVRPDRNEMIPLIQILADDRFKRAHDFLGQLLARSLAAQCGALVGNGRQNMRRVPVARSRQINR